MDLSPPADLVRASLADRHRRFRLGHGSAVRYRADVASFVAVPPEPTPTDWTDLATLLGSGGLADLFSATHTPPAAWEPVFALEGFQMVLTGEPDPTAGGIDVVRLGPDDAGDVGVLAAATRPGPFFARTHELGRFVGVRQDGVLVAMAGERLSPPGWTEISAVCTLPQARGRGLAGALVSRLAADVVGRGDRAFLHVMRANAGAVALYRRLGFEVVAEVEFRGFRVP